jgi:adenosine deaminase
MYRHRGVVGLDVAGPESADSDFRKKAGEYADLFSKVRYHGLGITVHVGESEASPPAEILEMIEIAKPHRIGHGVQAINSDEAMSALREKNICLEICPTSNLQTHAVQDPSHLRKTIRTFLDAEVPFTINTDNPYLSHTNLRYEIDLLLKNEILNQDELRSCFQLARTRSFIK